MKEKNKKQSIFTSFVLLHQEDKKEVKPVPYLHFQIIKWFKRLYWLVDIALAFLIYQTTTENTQIVGMVLFFGLIIYNGLYLFRWWRSRQIAKTNTLNYRAQSFSGPMRIGKTSFMLNILKMCLGKNEVYSNVPFMVDNQFYYILSKDGFIMKKKLEQKSWQILDEMTLYYNNLDPYKKREEIAGSEGQIQLVGHNTNGHVLATSVSMDRLLKTLEEKFGLDNRVLEQKSIKTGFIIPFIYWCCCKINKKLPYIYWGFRRWKVQTFLAINHDGYVYDLSTDNASTIHNKFVNLYYFYAFNDCSVVYDDRYCGELYQSLPPHEKKKFTSLKFNEDIVKFSGFDSIAKLYDIELKKKLEEAESLPPKPLERGAVGENSVSDVKVIDKEKK